MSKFVSAFRKIITEKEVQVFPVPMSYTYDQLAHATRNFAKLVEEDSSGSVYLGWLKLAPKSTEEKVAVKQLAPDVFQGEGEFLDKLVMLSDLDHPNIMKLLGYCFEEHHHCMIVYKYMPFGSLHEQLHGLTPNKIDLEWNTRIKIACGVAKALEYLHTRDEPSVIYRDLKSSHVLLDEGFELILFDVGFPKFCPNSEVLTCAPEYSNDGVLTPKSDVFAFGVMLLELITGKKKFDGVNYLVDKVREEFIDNTDISNYILLADRKLYWNFIVAKLVVLVDKALECVALEADERPTMTEFLNFIANVMGDDHTSFQARRPLLDRFYR